MEAIEIAAAGVVAGWLDSGIATIDDRFGEGFAQANPALLGAFVAACAAQVRNDRLAEDVSGTLEAIATSLASVAAAIASRE